MVSGNASSQEIFPPLILGLASSPLFDELIKNVLSSFSLFVPQITRSCYAYFNQYWEKLAEDLTLTQRGEIIDAYLSRTAVLLQDKWSMSFTLIESTI